MDRKHLTPKLAISVLNYNIWRCRRNGMAGDCKSSDLCHSWFDPNHLHQFGLKVFMDARQPVTLEEGDRYPLGPPDYKFKIASFCPL